MAFSALLDRAQHLLQDVRFARDLNPWPLLMYPINASATPMNAAYRTQAILLSILLPLSLVAHVLAPRCCQRSACCEQGFCPKPTGAPAAQSDDSGHRHHSAQEPSDGCSMESRCGHHENKSFNPQPTGVLIAPSPLPSLTVAVGLLPSPGERSVCGVPSLPWKPPRA